MRECVRESVHGPHVDGDLGPLRGRRAHAACEGRVCERGLCECVRERGVCVCVRERERERGVCECVCVREVCV